MVLEKVIALGYVNSINKYKATNQKNKDDYNTSTNLDQCLS